MKQMPANEVTLLDGGMSRELMRLGGPFKQPEWSALALMEAPDFVRKVHEDFCHAGANVLTTNSYALVPFHIGEERFWDQGRDLAALSGQLARETAQAISRNENGRKVLVAGCLPPIFGSYEPNNFKEDQVQKYLRVLVEGLSPCVDIWLGETLSLIAEAEAVREVVEATGKPLWIAFTPDDSQSASQTSPRLRSGETIEEVAAWALLNGVEALLFNCCRPEYMHSAIVITKEVFSRDDLERDKASLPSIGVYANSFVPRSDDYAANDNICRTDETITTDAYAQFVQQWIESGANIVGGCCGIGHEHIRHLSKICR